MQRARRGIRNYRRRAAVLVQVAVSATLVMGMGALAIDVGALYTAQAELQISADAAALAGAVELVGTADVQASAIAAADEYAGKNKVMGMTPKVYPEDVEFGRSTMTPGSDRFHFEPAGDKWDAIRVTVRHVESPIPGEKPAVAIPLSFAQVFGMSTSELQAQAAAVLIPRDISVVIDISNSMCWDSELRFWNRNDGGYSNLRDVWCALNGPEPLRPYTPGPEQQTEYSGDSGPTFGYMTNWGNRLLPGSYNPSSDPGLWYIKKSSTTNVAAITTLLTSTGYNSTERSALLSGSSDGTATHWRNRCGVLLGLAQWHSGKSKPAFPGGGNGDNKLDNNEVTWITYPSFRVSWAWTDYVDWMQSHYLSQFSYRYGLKTFTDFLLDNEPQSNQTNNLWATPEQPLRAVKDALQTMTDVILDMDNLDHMSLEVFATSARHQIDLTEDLQTVPNLLYQRQSGHYDRATCMGDGLKKAINELTSARSRHWSAKVIVLMSDGQPNIDQYGNSTADGAPAAVNYAIAQAEDAADRGFRIYTVSVGYSAARGLMQQIATIGKGEEFYAAGSPEEYTAQLEEIFRALGGKRPVSLLE